jgi:dihydrofolate reductase
MRKIKLYIASSLNGTIADSMGRVDWLESLPKPDNGDYGYADFFASVDTTLQGYNTYQQILDWKIPFPYPDKKNYVLTRKQNIQPAEFVSFINKHHLETILEIKNSKGKDIWLIGGGQVNTLLFNTRLIDEIWVFIMPIVLPGISIFEGLPILQELELLETRNYPTGVVALIYKPKKTEGQNPQ